MRNRILSIVRNTIPYAKELRQLPQVKSVASAILMQQLDYWFEKYPDGFYKFMQPCPNHKAYKEGDSWAEELAFSSDEFRNAFDLIGKRYTSKTAWKEQENKFEVTTASKDESIKAEDKYYCSYQDKKQGVTWYFRNHPLVDAALDTLHIIQEKPPQALRKKPIPVDGQEQSTVDRQWQSIEMGNSNLHRSALPIYSLTEITPENTSETTHKEEEAAAENFDFETVEVLPPRTSIEPPPKEKEVQINFSPSRIGELIAVPFEHVAYDWRLRPWMLSQTNFAPEMIQAVWQCNIEWYSLEGSKTPNLKKITSRLKKLDGQLKALDSNAQAAYKELQNYWVVAQAIANPEIGQTFTSAVVKQKQQQKYSSIEQALQKPEGGIF